MMSIEPKIESFLVGSEIIYWGSFSPSYEIQIPLLLFSSFVLQPVLAIIR